MEIKLNKDFILSAFDEKGIMPLEMIWINAGNFKMGSEEKEKYRSESEKQFKSIISHGYWLGKFPVTQFQWQFIMKNNPSKFQADGKNKPVDSVNWEDAMNFCKNLNIKYKNSLPQGYFFSLPTESQWEYACKANQLAVPNNELMDDIAWYNQNSNNESQTVGSKTPNAWNFYDMLGNVFEWCYDSFSLYPNIETTDRIGEAKKFQMNFKTFRGGAWSSSEMELRASARGYAISDEYARPPWFGFRLCLRFH
jgi:formylglycine-generating enzyme required for sulfatase activity